MAFRVVASLLMTALVVQLSLAFDEVNTKATCADGDATCELDRVSMLQLNTYEDVLDQGHTEVARLLNQASDCAGQATAFLRASGEAWTDFIELLLPQNSKVAQIIDALTPLLREFRMETLATIGIAERTKPPCPESLQQTNASMLLEATQALNKVVGEQLEEIDDNIADKEASSQKLTELASSMPFLDSLMCPVFTDFMVNLGDHIIKPFHEKIHTLKEDSLLQVGAAEASMAQSVRLTENACKVELSAFVAYAQDMVQHCKAMRDCKDAISLWIGLDKASQECIDVFSKFSMESDMRSCK